MYLYCLPYDDYVDHDGGDDANLNDDQENDDDDDVRKGMSILRLYYPLLPSPVLRPRLLRAYFKNTELFSPRIPNTKMSLLFVILYFLSFLDT